MRALMLVALVGCGGTDTEVGPDAAGTKSIAFTTCEAFSAGALTRDKFERPCVFVLTGVDWFARDGLPAVFVDPGPNGSDPFTIEFIGVDTYRAEAHTWTGAEGLGEAVVLKEQGQCAWVKCTGN